MYRLQDYYNNAIDSANRPNKFHRMNLISFRYYPDGMTLPLLPRTIVSDYPYRWLYNNNVVENSCIREVGFTYVGHLWFVFCNERVIP